MKKVILFLSALFVFFVAKVQAQGCGIPEPLDKSEAIGIWKGTYLENGISREVKIKILEDEESLKTEIAIGSANFKTAKTVLCPSQDLHLITTENGNRIEFRGIPKNGKLSGRVFYLNDNNNSVAHSYTLKKSTL
ncbi:hypothetical protein [Psychroserpens algicola]|uniref:TIGR03067 domain-containing protein n=1 Tax=Psychroserpens algicola TaxID=1719034 RepID=A0ABT0H5Z9_9FLAO|nr:hypothetical protein [Psychroserpens algicola]MCK8479790.1 hypothetical protein [Psychroserpens algicola]